MLFPTIKQEKEKSEKHVDLAQELRKQKRSQRLHRRVVIVIAVLAILAYASGVFSAVFSVGKTWQENITISVANQSGYPVQTGISDIYQVEELSGGFALLGEEGCVIYSAGGNRLRSIQTGYLRPTLSVGGSGYILYNLAGNELRVESRTETIATKTYTNSIMTACISENGAVAVATESDRYLATITIYSSNMTEQLSYSMTESEGYPIRMAYSSDNKTLAVATIAASDGQMISHMLLVSTQGNVVCIDTQVAATPLAIEWVSKTECVVIYDTMAVWYSTQTQQEVARYAYQNKTLADYAVYGGDIALLFAESAQSEVVLLQNKMETQTLFETDYILGSVAIDGSQLHLVYEKQIESYTYAGEYIATTQCDKKIQALLVGEQIFLFTAGETSIFTPPTL